ncbi:TIGR02444 family protein [Pseudomonas xionganensis]|uniref:TIGR02444 family protein n=1 Tax=Pseudomonas xionganensis TaxID=2654845 RepID=A0A6I4KT99_9PSED|nr:TIGR02444 family protein [Pseudomonas xionganensis]MVW73832.1 TIGR02444 family protein [Pseudomonas xionganensis]
MPSDLWRFAQELYRQPGVEAACLQLQGQGADVCLLLCAAWLERRQIACDEARADALDKLARPWQAQVVLPLRQLRQQWREAARDDKTLARLREQIKVMELDAEREQLQRLAICARNWSGGDQGSAGYWLESLAPASADRATLHRLRSAAVQLSA